mmetsp:Transcript_74751/g.118952  ORF Transcript_74751/g.118952 Transcript_74751/m.118952 type:complete len:97 (+) Transcript_74751:106-396(+)
MEVDILRHQNVKTARRYFIFGFFGLPFLWVLNYCYFKSVIYEPQCHPLVHRYAILSKWFSIIFIVLLLAWLITFWIINGGKWHDLWYISEHEDQTL